MADQTMGVLVSLALIGLGLTFGVLAAGMARKLVEASRTSVRSRTWLSTPGRITHSELIWVGGRSRSPRPEVRYAYRVAGAPYEGQRIAFEYSHTYSREEAEEILQEYSPGAAPLVYYDPTDPRESTLRQASLGLVSGLMVASTLLLPMALCLVAGFIGFVESLGLR